MVSKFLVVLWIAFGSSLGNCFEKLPLAYHIGYGDRDAPIRVVEYFSFTCQKCLKLIREEFDGIKGKYIDSGKVYWVFHPDPADKLTLQAMLCLEKLDDAQKRLFFEVISKNLDSRSLHLGCSMMQTAMEYFKLPLPELDKMDYLEATDAFRGAFAFLKQADVIQSVPTIEINGTLRDEFPSRRFLEKQFNSLSGKDALPCK